MIQLATGCVVLDHFFERRQAPIMHVGRRDGDVPQRGRAELSDVFGSSGLFKESTIRRGVRGYTGIEEGAAAEIPSGVALKTTCTLTREK
jgi:hypothetical protein